MIDGLYETIKNNENCWHTTSDAKNCPGNMGVWFNEPSLQNSAIIHPHLPLLSTLSSFAGLGIYNIKKIRGCRYNGKNGKDCEHVAFHKDMRDKYNARIFINPKMHITG